MIGAVEDITVNEGIDPRDSYLVSGGGATACHIGEMAQILGIKRFMIPSFAAGFARNKQRFEHAYQGRYLYQSWDIEVPFALPGDRLAASDIPRLAAAFHQMHERIYTIKDENDVIEFTTWKVRAVGDTGGAGRRGVDLPKQAGTPQPKSRRPVYLGAKQGFVELPVYQGDGLGSGARIDGPALIEEPTTTILLLQGQTTVTDAHRNYLVELTV